MKTAKATLKNFRQSPRKMRMVANLVRGKKVSDVLVNLDFVAKKASLPIKNLILSAVANAKNLDISTENLVVKTIAVNSGSIMYRRRPASRGSAHPIRKRTSSVTIELGEKESKVNGKKVKIEKNPSNQIEDKKKSESQSKTEVKKSKKITKK